MPRSWANVRPSKRAQLKHPLLAFGGELAQLSAKNKNRLEQEGKGCNISLAIGDPTLDGNIPPPLQFMDSLKHHLQSMQCNGYTPSAGDLSVRKAVADYWVNSFAPSLQGKIGGEAVLLTSGCSDALSLAFGSLGNVGDRILIPQPYFAQYELTSAYYGIEPLFYPCDSKSNWEVDLTALRRLIEDDTAKTIKGILINNPSNPCGSNFSRSHLEALVALVDELQVPIVSDEIYAGMTFNVLHPEEEEVFTSVADITASVPRLVVGGASKRFSVPGARMGWIIAVDQVGCLSEVLTGIYRLSGRFLVPMTPLQLAIKECLRATDESYFANAKQILRTNAAYLYEALKEIPGLEPILPQGGMFMSVLLKPAELQDSICSGRAFAARLAEEENIHVFPGEAFRMPSAIRLTLTRPPDITEDAVRRLRDFCQRYSRRTVV